MLSQRLKAVQAKAQEIVKVEKTQIQIAAEYRSHEVEWQHVDEGTLNKIKYIFYILLAAHILLTLWTPTVNTVLSGMNFLKKPLINSILSIAVTVVLFEVLWGKDSKIVKVIQVIYLLFVVKNIIRYLSFMVTCLFEGAFWGFFSSVVVLAAAIFAIFFLLHHQNKRIDAQNERIRAHNEEIDSENAVLSEQFDQLAVRLTQLQAEFARMTQPDWYPKSACYRTPAVIKRMVKLVDDMEAYSMQEVVYTIKEQDYQTKMLQVQKQMLWESQQQTINQAVMMSQLDYMSVQNGQIIDGLGFISGQLGSISGQLEGIGGDVRDMAGIARRWNRKWW